MHSFASTSLPVAGPAVTRAFKTVLPVAPGAQVSLNLSSSVCKRLALSTRAKGSDGSAPSASSAEALITHPAVITAVGQTLFPWLAPLATVATALGVPAQEARESGGSSSSSSSSSSNGNSSHTALEIFARSSVFALIALNCFVYAISAWLPLLSPSSLQLTHSMAGPAWYQFLTSMFVHTSVEGLTQAVFFIYTFGRLLESSFGHWAVFIVYAASALGAAGLSSWLLPGTKSALLSTSAPAACMGLFVAGILMPRMLRKGWEVMCLAPWVYLATVGKYSHLTYARVVEGTPIGHLLHVAGAALAAAAVFGVLHTIQQVRAHMEAERQEEARRRGREQADKAMNNIINFASRAASEVLGGGGQGAGSKQGTGRRQ